jgi:hypothetical protein
LRILSFMSKTKLIVFIIILVFLTCLFILDYRYVNLSLIGIADVEPPNIRGDNIYWFIASPKFVKYQTMDAIVHEIKISNLDNHFNQEFEVKIPDDLLDRMDGQLYVCMGCEINEISFFYHTKTTNQKNGEFDSFVLHSSKLSPLKDKGKISIYKADILARPF